VETEAQERQVAILFLEFFEAVEVEAALVDSSPRQMVAQQDRGSLMERQAGQARQQPPQ
jgi:hypothetical protein